MIAPTYTTADARDALQHCDAGTDRRQWVRILAAAKDAGLSVEDVLTWSASAPNFSGERDVMTAWRSISTDGGIKAGTLYHEARAAGWTPRQAGERAAPPQPAPATRPVVPAKPPRWSAAEVWATGRPATAAHPYICRKAGDPEGLRICTKPVRIGGADMAGALLVPVRTLAGELVSLQFIPADGQKMNLSGHPMRGVHVVGDLSPDGLVYVVEGIGQAWACWQATGCAAVVAFGWGRVRAVAGELLALHPGLRVVLVPDAGKEGDAQAIAADVGCQWVEMPADSPANFDANDYAAQHGAEELAELLEATQAPALPEPSPAPAGPLNDRPAADWLDARDGTEDTRPLTEHGNAMRLFDGWGDRLRYLPERRAWLVWDAGRWTVSDGGLVRSIAAQLPDAIYREGLRHGRDGQHFARWARKSQEVRIVTAAVQMLSDMQPLRLTVAELDADPMLCGLDGGRKVLDLRTGTVRAAVQADHITKSLSVSDIGEASKAVRWVQFLDEVTRSDPELSDWLHRFLGYCLTGLNTEQAFVFLFGHGANGKSVLTEAVQSLMGHYAAGIQPATLCDDKRTGAGPSPDLARLNGVRFAVAPEAEEGSRFAESMLKALVSGDTIPVRELNCAPFDMRPCLKLALTGNHKPHISGTDRGIWRRVRLVPFAASFEGRADPHLSAKLRLEFQHILAWLVAGCLAWQRQGLADTPPRHRRGDGSLPGRVGHAGAVAGRTLHQRPERPRSVRRPVRRLPAVVPVERLHEGSNIERLHQAPERIPRERLGHRRRQAGRQAVPDRDRPARTNADEPPRGLLMPSIWTRGRVDPQKQSPPLKSFLGTDFVLRGSRVHASTEPLIDSTTTNCRPDMKTRRPAPRTADSWRIPRPPTTLAPPPGWGRQSSHADSTSALSFGGSV